MASSSTSQPWLDKGEEVEKTSENKEVLALRTVRLERAQSGRAEELGMAEYSQGSGKARCAWRKQLFLLKTMRK